MLAYKASLTIIALVVMVVPLADTVATAQDYPAYGAPPGGPPPGPGYDAPDPRYGGAAADRGPSGYDDTQAPPPPPGYQGDSRYGAAPDERPGGGYDVPPPPGYDGAQAPPPPPGYQADPRYAPQPDEDRRYEAYAEDWAQRYCVRAPNNAGAGAVIGGLFGALLGSGLAGRHDRGGGAILGGVAGAAGGAAIGSTSTRATSPGCPPGYVVRREAPAFYYPAGPYLYAAPGWYRPWVFYGGRWTYRPYPYHVWYAQRFGYGRPYRPYGPGYRRRPW